MKPWLDPQFRRSCAIAALGLLIAGGSSVLFRRLHQPEPLFPASPPTALRMLSDYHPPLKGTPGDTAVYVYDSGVPGGTLCILGGVHPNEPSSFLTAVTLLENLSVEKGRVIIVPRSNASAYTHNDPQEANLQYFPLATGSGPRRFRNGSRFTNPVHQWPDPSTYLNPPGVFWEDQQKRYPVSEHAYMAINPGPFAQTLSGVDSRNLNRVFPGMPNGSLTEQIAFALVTLVREEKADLVIDYHEASLEYPTINVIVAHPRSADVAAMAEMFLSGDGVNIATDPSSPQLRGLSHREIGDATDAKSILMETANPAMGRLKGRPSVHQLVDGVDHTYYRAKLIEDRLNVRLAARAAEAEATGDKVGERRRKIIYVDVPAEGIPLALRVGRHLQATVRLVEAFSDDYPDRAITLTGLPEYDQIIAHGLGHFLHGPNGEPPAWRLPQ